MYIDCSITDVVAKFVHCTRYTASNYSSARRTEELHDCLMSAWSRALLWCPNATLRENEVTFAVVAVQRRNSGFGSLSVLPYWRDGTQVFHRRDPRRDHRRLSVTRTAATTGVDKRLWNNNDLFSSALQSGAVRREDRRFHAAHPGHRHERRSQGSGHEDNLVPSTYAPERRETINVLMCLKTLCPV